ncbi:putative mitochondrial hypothetical protein [Leptomonas pyrrhocoris]|uniref:Uncharacterized protein n=1 Tax=Leptomonas pyrrhocoris TaxID=157538 RepID=A0A0N0DUI8_LEPPY|nr:putative mitochondrial hypothetical protein [Leptomonas pyrrhocoris]KPA78992.1 putative mitochondrial hypothetical protein [Leptomonas pyrrhocoris]|eukprot:XP_015657431.1 putative mitochondrial hypothetical protein [Leptomonas pyrrhocoris]
MRAFRFQPLVVFPVFGIRRFYGGQGGARPPPPRSGGRYPRGGGSPPASNRNVPSEPQVIARLIEHFPSQASFVPISRWATALPDDLQEALVPFGGLSAFTRAQANFFIVRQENGVTVASLSPMGSELARQHTNKEKREQKRIEKLNQRRGRNDQRNRGAGPYVPPSKRE